MLKTNVGLRRAAPRKQPGRFRVARWVGRNWARLSYGYRVEPTWLEINEICVPVAGLPKGFEGLRIAQLSDFHLSRRVPLRYVRQCIEKTNRLGPDLVALTGDFVHRGPRYIALMTRMLAELEAPLGVYAVLGNHDYAVRTRLGLRRSPRLPRLVSAALEARGIRVLANEGLVLRRGEDALGLAGVEDLWSRRCDPSLALATIADDVPRVVLAHNPQTVELMGGRRCDLMLSGHTHGGQINLPRLGAPMLSRRMRQYSAGLYRFGDTYLYVNKGIGYGMRFRYRTRPEVAILSLTAAEVSAIRGNGESLC